MSQPGRKVESFKVSGGADGSHWKVFLWPDRASFHSKIKDASGADGMHHPHPIIINRLTRKRRPTRIIASIHFVRDKWDMEVVAHECMHAVAHYIRATGAKPLGHKSDDMGQEEKCCYLFGKMVDSIYRQLWEMNPYRTTEQ